MFNGLSGEIKLWYNHGYFYPTPLNLDYNWSFGSLSGLSLVIQIVSGVFLAMNYTSNADLAFDSVEHIMRDVNYGWLFRYVHANGASMFFIVVYAHIARSLYHSSHTSPRTALWLSGWFIFLLMMATAFLGYVLPWGQMSFWGVTVITNLFSVIPYVGESIVQWIWGGFSVNNSTLSRFFSLHYFLPFIILGLVILHLSLLHSKGSNNPVSTPSFENIPFHPYYTSKDHFAFYLYVITFSYFVFYNPNLLGHPDNYIPANPLVTPTHIVPEWYFLPFYAILRSIPSKLGGAVCMGLAILVMISSPMYIDWIFRRIELKVKSESYSDWRLLSSVFNVVREIYWYLFIGTFIILGWIGGQVVEPPFTIIGQFFTFFYFFIFFVGPTLLTYFLSNIASLRRIVLWLDIIIVLLIPGFIYCPFLRFWE